MVFLGIVIGFIVGALALSWPGGLAGGFVGFIVALALRSRSQARERMTRPPPQPQPQPDVAPAKTAVTTADDMPDARTVARRFAAIDARLTTLERLAGVAEEPAPTPPVVTPSPAPSETPEPEREAESAAPVSRLDVPLPSPPPIETREPETAAAAISDLVRAADGTLMAPTVEKRVAAESAPATPRPPVAPAPASTNRLWAWFTGGNTLTRIGVLVLFFGIGFLLKYFAELITIPIEVKLAGVALVGVALVVLGMRLALTRAGYGLSLQGAGAGILYLTTFAAFRQYEVLPAVPAFALLVLVSVLTVWLAVRADSQALAALAVAGGFLAPFLVATSTSGAPARLFGYFCVLNAAIFALAWVKAWRGLNVLGFVFTFALGLFWGRNFYRPEHFASVEPFLIAFFLFYVAIAVLYAKRGALEAKAPVDALLVFGVPLVGFALQAGLVHDTRYGVAWSAFAIAALYGVLALSLFRRPEPGFSLLARAFGVLAVIFGTIAIPFAVDPRWTSAWWALESAGVYWIGCRQRQGLARAFALLLQLGAALAFLAGFEPGDRLFLNATYLGTTLIALAALATAFVADRHRDVVSGNEKHLVGPLVLYGVGWWYAGGALELARELSSELEGNAFLGYATGSVVIALILRRWLRWPRLAWFGVALLPVMALVALADWDRLRTTLLYYGWLVWPLAWFVHWRVLRAADGLRIADLETGKLNTGVVAFLRFAHAASAIAVVAWLAWEASEWVGHMFPAGTVWVACAAAWPAIVYLALIARARGSGLWPFTDYGDAYASSAGTAIATLLAVWFAIANFISPGGAAPLPYAPLINPLDLTLGAALAVLFAWVRDTARVAERSLYAWFGLALFLFLNAVVFRSVHQWLDVPWRLSSLLSSKPLQAALTLTWTATALPLMLVATKRAVRPLWMVGAALLAIVVVKLFVIDLSALSGLPRVVAFLGVGVLLLLIGYLAPLPPAASDKDAPAVR